jgi:hypothetical protein
MAIPMGWLFSWEVSSWVVGGAIAAAFSFLALDDFKLAKLFFLLAAADAIGGIVMWGAKTELPPWGRSLLIFAMIGSIGVLADQALRYVDKKQKTKLSQSASPEVQPSVTLTAYLQPKEPYPDGTFVGGISWLSHYVDVRLDVVNGPIQIKDLDFSVQFDTDIAGAGQISQFQGVTIFPDKEPPATWLEGFDSSGQPTSVPVVSAPGKMRNAAIYRMHCQEVLANTVVHFVIASVAFNRPMVGGQMPKQLFAPRRAPKEIRVKGQYAVQVGQSTKWYPLEFSYNFPQLPALPSPQKPGDESKTQEFAKLQFTFWPVDPKDERLSDELSLPVVNGVVTVVFSAKNVGKLQAENGQVWIRICDACKYAEEPEGTTMPPGDPLVRRKRFDTLHIGSYFEGTILKVIPPNGASSFTIALKYACERCPPIDNRNPQKLRVHILGPLSTQNGSVSGHAPHAPEMELPLARALHSSNWTVADQLSQLIDAGSKIMGAFLRNDNVQALAEDETVWDAEAQAVLAANLGQRYADEFRYAQSTTTIYPAGHSVQGGSIFNLMDAKIAVLSRFVNELRAAGPR